MTRMRRAVARIVDANLNRAREAMRVIEDFARFLLDDPATTRSLKQMRHDLAAAARIWPPAELLAARDTPGDVGTVLTTRAERQRLSPAHVAMAAAKRLTEALRVLEEYAKLDDPPAAAAFKQMRYRAYGIEKTLVERLPRAPALAAERFSAVRLYVLITESLCRGPWLKVAAEAIAGGADCLQLREKELDDAQRVDRARRLVQLCRRHNVLCVVNDRPDIARVAGADGVHLGQTDMTVADARAVVGPDAIIGKSTHSLRQFRAALRERPDYLAIGPMYATATKPQRHIPGPRVLPQALDLARSVPVVAIGGITVGRLGPIVEAGCRRVAVCSAVVGADDPRAAARRLKRRLKRGP